MTARTIAGLIVCGLSVPVAAADRTTLAIRYEEGRTTEIRLDGTAASPHVRGKAKVQAKRGAAAIEVELDDVQPASTFGPCYATYVLWGITPEGRTNNLGELPWKGDVKVRVMLPVQRFGLLVTAEPYGAVTRPSPRVVAENRGSIRILERSGFRVVGRGRTPNGAEDLMMALDEPARTPPGPGR